MIKILQKHFLDNSGFRQVDILKSTNRILEKYLSKNQFSRLLVPILSTKFFKNTSEEIHILESFSASMNKIFDIHLRRKFFLSLPYEVYSSTVYVIVLNAPVVKFLTSVSVN